MPSAKLQSTTTYIALLRGVNVGGTGMIAMKDLAVLCAKLGLENVRTYIQSGNVVFQSKLPENKLRASLEQALEAKMGKHVDVILRTALEMQSVLDSNPFQNAPSSKVLALFFAERLPPNILNGVIAPEGEQVRAAERELYIHYVNGMGRSKLKLPKAASKGTGRNINTITKLTAMAKA